MSMDNVVTWGDTPGEHAYYIFSRIIDFFLWFMDLDFNIFGFDVEMWQILAFGVMTWIIHQFLRVLIGEEMIGGTKHFRGMRKRKDKDK